MGRQGQLRPTRASMQLHPARSAIDALVESVRGLRINRTRFLPVVCQREDAYPWQDGRCGPAYRAILASIKTSDINPDLDHVRILGIDRQRACHPPAVVKLYSSGVQCFRCFLMRSLHYLTGRTPSPFPGEPEHPKPESYPSGMGGANFPPRPLPDLNPPKTREFHLGPKNAKRPNRIKRLPLLLYAINQSR